MWGKGGREAVRDGTASCSVKLFQFGEENNLLKQGNHPHVAYVRKDQIKALYRIEKDS